MDGVNLTTEVVYKRGQDYRFVCYNQGHACQSYRVRFLCGRPGKQLFVRDTSAAVALSLEPAAARCKFGRLGPLPASSSAAWSSRQARSREPCGGQWGGPSSGGSRQSPTLPTHLSGLVGENQGAVDGVPFPWPSRQRHAARCLFGCWIMLNPDPKTLVRRGWKWPVVHRGTGHLPKAVIRDGRSSGGGLPLR